MINNPPKMLLVLHAVRTLGYTTVERVVDLLGLSVSLTTEHLLDAQAYGWVTVSSYAGDSGWSMTEAGKKHGEQLLAAELDATGARDAVTAIYQDFLPLNEIVSQACTSWQLAELGIGPAGVDVKIIIDTLVSASEQLKDLEDQLLVNLPRFVGYHSRFDAAVIKSRSEPAWITATDRDSCHLVWFQLHEDLIATLGLTR